MCNFVALLRLAINNHSYFASKRSHHRKRSHTWEKHLMKHKSRRRNDNSWCIMVKMRRKKFGNSLKSATIVYWKPLVFVPLSVSRLPFCLSWHINIYTFEMRADHIKIPNNLSRLVRTVLENHDLARVGRLSTTKRVGKKCSEKFVDDLKEEKTFEELWKMYVRRLGSPFACIVCSRFVS